MLDVVAITSDINQQNRIFIWGGKFIRNKSNNTEIVEKFSRNGKYLRIPESLCIYIRTRELIDEYYM